MDKYEEYKDSGVKWLGQIPKEWEVSRVKNCFYFGKGLAITKADLTDNGIKVISYGQIHSKENSGVGLNERLYRFVPKTYLVNNASAITKTDDFLFADTSEDYAGIGDCSLVDNDETIFAGYHTIIARPYNVSCPKYQAYLFTTDAWRNQLRANSFGVKVFSITQKTLKDVLILLPSLDEQKKIVDYLDYRCMIIDADIARRKSIIAKCQEYRQSVITEAVTKGLDKNVPMQDSGVEWIGKIPKKWKVIKLKHLTKNLGSGTTPASSNAKYYDGKLNWIQSGDLYGKDTIVETEKHITEMAITDVKSLKLFKSPFIVIAMYGASVGNSAISEIDAYLNQACYAFDVNEKAQLQYMFYVVMAMKKNLINDALGGGQPNISQSIVSNAYVPKPLLQEQNQIVSYLDKQCAKIDAIINNNTKLVEKLEELKKSLIYEVVTGKRKVC
jgi:type I restriction enzyme S subunit